MGTTEALTLETFQGYANYVVTIQTNWLSLTVRGSAASQSIIITFL
jgi:hypothetical protein